MEVTGRMNILLAIFLLWFYGFAVSQHLDCPSEDWVVGSSITFWCYVPKADFPSKCVIHPDTVTIRLTTVGATPTRCTFSGVSTNTCSGSSNECSCKTGNATYYILQYTFTAGTDDSGSWKCEANCFDATGTLPQLPSTNNNCGNRDVEPTTTPPPTTPDAPDCKLLSLKSCDTPGIIIIICICIICIICIVYICLYLWGQTCILTCNANCHKQCGCKGCCGMIKMFHCTWVCTKKCGCVPDCSCCPQDDPERSADIPIKQFPPKTEASGAGKPITRHDPADDGQP
ncbi:uncharacterized protein LOC143277491 isoform X2 [Babylonia areolata]|uniref:uncharacterized protein LOC143277491 isoform X2 n=1 Tax=Babylonia areolata TaxID=304850 RepID=UPI003FD46AE5